MVFQAGNSGLLTELHSPSQEPQAGEASGIAFCLCEARGPRALREVAGASPGVEAEWAEALSG